MYVLYAYIPGLLELVVIPLAITSLETPATGIVFSKRNLWGTSVWSGILVGVIFGECSDITICLNLRS